MNAADALHASYIYAIFYHHTHNNSAKHQIHLEEAT